ncbi:MAG: hypothetical protein IKZ00_03320 [Bacteroidaceae bacterium]|nr:hypothetical protein [Bacteroidaceae bacterium]
MAIIVKRDAERVNKVKISEMSYSLKWNMGDTNRHKVDKIVTSFYLVNDNLPNCRAHEKGLTGDEMIAIYEYMKKILEED